MNNKDRFFVTAFSIIFLVVLLAFLASCGSTTAQKKLPNDTTFSTVTYFAGDNPANYKTATTMRVAKDTLKPSADSSKLERYRDTIYHIPVLRDSFFVNGVVQKDSTGKYLPGWVWFECPREFVIYDYNKKWPR